MLIVLNGVLDYNAGIESFFYLIPVTLVAWYTGMAAGFVASLIGTFGWLTANLWLGEGFSTRHVSIGNSVTILGFYLAVSFFAGKLRQVLRRESDLARSDYLTGALNSRRFRKQRKMRSTERGDTITLLRLPTSTSITSRPLMITQVMKPVMNFCGRLSESSRNYPHNR